MIGLLLCCAAFVSCFLAGKRSQGAGLATAIAWGYPYGMLRAYFADSGAYFIFDSALLGTYLAHFVHHAGTSANLRTRDLGRWAMILVGWPLLLLVLPFQPILISLIGLRANILVLPAMLIGSRLRDEDLSKLAVTLSVLNIAVLIIAVLEYSLGLEQFFPQNTVTKLMFQMNDVANYTAYRIPSTFSQAHVYASTMICSVPFIFGAWVQTEQRRLMKVIVGLGLVSALLGILLAAARMTFVMTALIMMFASFKSKLGPTMRLVLYFVIVCVAITALRNERLQRFTTLSDTRYVQDRIAGSVNRSFFEIAFEYPLGNGLGGGGTSMPYFLEQYVRHPVGMESEYARIMLEQSVVGLLLWIAFLGWVFTRSTPAVRTAWREGRRLARFTCLLCFFSGLLGVGMFTAIPSNVLIFVMIGWFAVRPLSLSKVYVGNQNFRTAVLRTPASLSPSPLAGP